jgi:hypothetical protein
MRGSPSRLDLALAPIETKGRRESKEHTVGAPCTRGSQILNQLPFLFILTLHILANCITGQNQLAAV